MLLNGIRSMMGGHQGFAGDYDRASSGASHASSPWDSGGDRGSSDLARDAGAGDIGGGRHAAYDDSGRSGLLDDNADDQPDDQPDDDFDTGDFDGGGDSDIA